MTENPFTESIQTSNTAKCIENITHTNFLAAKTFCGTAISDFLQVDENSTTKNYIAPGKYCSDLTVPWAKG